MWITETWIPAAMVLGTIAGLFVAAAVNTRRGSLYGYAAGCLLLIGVAYLVDQRVVTPREEVVASTMQLTQSYVDDDQEAFLSQIDNDAPIVKGMAAAAFAAVDVHDDLRITDVSVTLDETGSNARIHLRANATIDLVGRGNIGRFPSRWNLDWKRVGDDWKLVGVQRLHPIDGTEITLLASQ